MSDSKSLFLKSEVNLHEKKALLIHANECVINLRIEVIEEKNKKWGMDKAKKTKGHNFSSIHSKI